MKEDKEAYHVHLNSIIKIRTFECSFGKISSSHCTSTEIPPIEFPNSFPGTYRTCENYEDAHSFFEVRRRRIYGMDKYPFNSSIF